ncbi:MAG: hypothetical protein MJZ86_06020 [Bacteroidales bacterium]|nr:hypothetical protein [Bacteroidales bacterium]
MKKFLLRNNPTFGVVLVVALEIICAALLALGLVACGVSITEHLRWFAAIFVAPLLLLRYYAKEKSCPLTLKAVVTTLFITFVIFMWYLLKYRYITFE